MQDLILQLKSPYGQFQLISRYKDYRRCGNKAFPQLHEIIAFNKRLGAFNNMSKNIPERDIRHHVMASVFRRLYHSVGHV